MTSPLIEANGIGFYRNSRHILKDTHLTISQGEIVTVIGPNGAGKSTLIKILLGLLKADRGEIKQSPRLRIGYMPQRLALENTIPISVWRFLTLSGKQTDWLQQCMAMCGVTALQQQPMQSLSGGELQRVLLARAIYRRPQLLVLDEPVQGVDVSGQSAMYRLIRRIRDQLQCAILMVSHDLHLVMASTDRVICLNQHVCCEGNPESVSADPEFLRLFGETAEAEVAIYTHEHDHQHDAFSSKLNEGHRHE